MEQKSASLTTDKDSIYWLILIMTTVAVVVSLIILSITLLISKNEVGPKSQFEPTSSEALFPPMV